MSLVKWLRKNNRKVMTFVVIFCMVSFVIGSFGLEMIVGIFSGGQQTIATYNDGMKIKSKDFMQAQAELDILKGLMADRLLIAQGQQGFAGPLLAYLLFPDSQLSSEVVSQLQMAVQQGQLPLTQQDLDDFFNQPAERAEILWLLLKVEAQDAGCYITRDSAKETLRYVIPQMTGNPQMDAAYVVNQITAQNNLTEAQITQVFSDLLGVMSYINQVIDNQSVSTNQIKSAVGRSRERINSEYVEIPAQWFIDEQAPVSDARILQQFEAYKTVASGNPTKDNPFGFGYKLPKRVRLEYIIVNLDDVAAQIKKPTMDEMEAYYNSHINEFTQQSPATPDDPDAVQEVKRSPYVEVEASIRLMLENEKSSALVNRIFNDIKTMTETGFESINMEEATYAELQIAAEGKYDELDSVAKKYNVPIRTGKTGWLSPEAIGQDDILDSLALQQGQNMLPLTDLAFTATQEKQVRQRLGVPSIRLWENIGPMDGRFYSEEQEKYFRVMAMVRVIDMVQPETPESPDVTYPTQGAHLADSGQESTFVLKDQIKNDILLLEAMKQAQKRAEELAQLVKQTNWDQAVINFNKKYAPTDPNEDTADSQRIELTEIKNQTRISQSEIQMIKRFMAENPVSASSIQTYLTSNMLTTTLYEMLPEGSQSTGTIEQVVPFEGQQKYLVVKDVTRVPATMEDYLKTKSQAAFQISSTESAGIVLTHLNPKNIKSRFDFQRKQEDVIITQEQAIPIVDEMF